MKAKMYRLQISQLEVADPQVKEVEIAFDKSLWELGKAILRRYRMRLDCHHFGFYLTESCHGTRKRPMVAFETFMDFDPDSYKEFEFASGMKDKAKPTKTTSIKSAFRTSKAPQLFFLFDYGDQHKFRAKLVQG